MNINSDGLLDEICMMYRRWDPIEKVYYCEACESEWDEERVDDPLVHEPCCLAGITVMGLLVKYGDKK